MPIPCQRGYYGATTGLYTSTCSGACDAGYYCDYLISYSMFYGNGDLPLCINNDNGGGGNPNSVTHHCYTGSVASQQTICPAGHYCPAGSIMATPCAIGTYSASTGNTQASDCNACDGGQYCYTRGLTAP